MNAGASLLLLEGPIMREIGHVLAGPVRLYTEAARTGCRPVEGDDLHQFLAGAAEGLGAAAAFKEKNEWSEQ